MSSPDQFGFIACACGFRADTLRGPDLGEPRPGSVVSCSECGATWRAREGSWYGELRWDLVQEGVAEADGVG